MTSTILIGVVLFLSTLRSFYFYSLGASIDNLTAFVLPLIWINFRHLLNKKVLRLEVLVLFAVTWGAIVTIGKNARMDTALSIIFYSLACIPFAGISRNEAGQIYIKKSLELIILVHAFFLLLQFFYMVCLNQVIDFVFPITGEVSRLDGGAADNLGIGFFFRASGLFNEPGTFSAYILPMLCMAFVLNKFKYNICLVAGTVAVVATFSTQAIISLACFLLLSLRMISPRSAFLMFFIVPPITYSLYFSVWDRYVVGGLNDPSLNTRWNSVSEAFDNVFGNGFVDPTIAIADSTSFVYWWWYVGIACLPFFTELFNLVKRNFYSVILICLLLTSKIPATAPLYWVLIYCIVGISDLTKYDKNINSHSYIQ